MRSFKIQLTFFVVFVLIIIGAFSAISSDQELAETENGANYTASSIVTTQLKTVPREIKKDLAEIELVAEASPESDSFFEKNPSVNSGPDGEDKPVLVKKTTPFSILVSDLDESGAKIAKNAEKRWPIASISKLMTAVIALENLSPEETITVSKTAEESEGIAGKIKNQEVYSVEDLIRAMIVVSSNDAAAAIANRFGADIFADMMQIKASELGMYNTTFTEPIGLSYLNQSSAEDILKLIQYIDRLHPQILEYSTQRKTFITEQVSQSQTELGNINNFAGRADFLGGKTGYTDEAKGNLISVFDYNGQEILVVVFGSDNRFEASLEVLEEYKNLGN